MNCFGNERNFIEIGFSPREFDVLPLYIFKSVVIFLLLSSAFTCTSSSFPN